MTDDKKAPDIEGFDWDKALSEWDDKGFAPEIAKDKETDKPAAPLSGSSTSKPLYRPPTAAKPPVAKAAAPSPPPPPEPEQDVEEEEGGATVVAAIPRELLRTEEAPKSSSRAGLGQLFGREEKRDVSVEVSFEESISKVETAPARETPSEVFTSARPVVAARAGEPEALRRPSQVARGEQVPEGAMFDPFAEDHEPRSEQSTRPAEEELDSLLSDVAPASAGATGTPTLPPPSEAPPEEQPSGRAPSLLAPDDRRYDPNEETMVGKDADVERVRHAAAALRTQAARAEALAELAPEASVATPAALPLPATRGWPDEKPASAWLTEATRRQLEERGAWLEGEARTLSDKIARARGLLACSELAATVGDHDRALALAVEARDLAPSLALAHRQARALMPDPPDPEEVLAALDAEVKTTPAGPARTHSALLAAETLRAGGDDEGAFKRLDAAARVPGDARAAVLRAARALGRGETASATLRMPEGVPELSPVADALQIALRLRGAERKEGAPAEPSPGDILLQARAALDKADVAGAAPLLAGLAAVPELAGGATWLAAALAATRGASRTQSVMWLQGLAAGGDDAAKRALIARAMELDDAASLAQAATGPAPLTSAERVALGALTAAPLSPSDAHVEATAAIDGLLSLVAASAALASTPADEAAGKQRAERTAGSPASRRAVQLGRLLGASAGPVAVEAAAAPLEAEQPSRVRALALENAVRSGRMLDVSREIETWGASRGSAEDRASGALVAALIAERAGETGRALEAYKTARATEPANEAALRAVAALESVDLVGELNALADELGEGPRAAITRLEAIARGEGVLPDSSRADLLERAHRAAPSLPLAAFLAERLARKSGDVEGVLRWIRERRTTTSDAIEAALEGVREALLLADRDRALASERLHEATRARPGDVALRQLFERTAPDAADDTAEWREQRAAEATGDARALLLLEAARDYERAGDDAGALRCAEAAVATDAPLARVARERTALRAAQAARLADELLSIAKSTEDIRVRREAYERLAVLDATARHDPASALLWHRSILEELPGYLPSLRHVEQHLIGEGRDDELEPTASALAVALRGTGAGEATAHAELAARLRGRGAEGSWEAGREMVELAAAEQSPSLWALRMLEAHSRARKDDETYLRTTLRLVEQTSRPLESATLLLHAGRAAARLGRTDEARALLERAALEDPGDALVWGLLAAVRQQAGNARGAAEACEALARSSAAPAHQVEAWFEAGRVWQDEAKDNDHAMVCLEAASAIEPAYKDVFDRLSRLYATLKMQPELAALLERRLESIADPDERLAMEVRRGKILLEVGDAGGALSAFQSALAQRPDDTAALLAYADLCTAQKDWDAAERALVRLARLLPTAEEQRGVYTRLGDLYSHHQLNLSRAEVALKEVLKRAPDDIEATEKLVDVYRRQNDPARAIEVQQELMAKSTTHEDKRRRLIALASIHEQTAHDVRKAEQTLEAARREFPQDVGVLRALAEFYIRQQQTPAVHVLLDRAGADARRAVAAGRISPAVFEVLAAVFELRGRKDAAAVTRALLGALEGRPGDICGAAERALDPRLDDLLAPEVLSPAMRALLARTGDALDAALPLDVRGLRATPMPADAPLARMAAGLAQAAGLSAVQVLVSPKLGAQCLPASSTLPTIVVGEALGGDERVARFLVTRALKLVQAHASAFGRTPPSDLAVLVSAWLKCFNPTWQPQGVQAAALNAVGGKVQAGLPRKPDPDLVMMAMEISGAFGTQAATLGPSALAWGNRVALLAWGDPNAAIDAIAQAGGVAGGAPTDPKERTTFVTRTAEARDLVGFGVTDAFAEARARLGLDR